MTELDDYQLLEEYARTESETAFSILVARYVNLVYSAGLRFTSNPHHAEEISQAVFVILARKAGSLRRGTVLSGWLYQTARLTAANFVKGETRRHNREQEAYMQSTLTDPDAAAWKQIAPLLDEAMGQLGEADRNAIVLRYFENKTLREVAVTLNLNEATVQKRVSRAVDKLRQMFLKRGVISTAVNIAEAVSAQSVQPVPAALTKSITAVALTKGSAASASTLTLIRDALKLMAWTKLKATFTAVAVAMLVAGTGLIGAKGISYYRKYALEESVWRHLTRLDWRLLDTAPKTVAIRPAQFIPGIGSGVYQFSGNKRMAFGVSAAALIGYAYNASEARIINPEALPPGKYDYAVTLPDHQTNALQSLVEEKFGLAITRETRETDVLLLKVATPNAPGLKPSPPNSSGSLHLSPGHVTASSSAISVLQSYLERRLQIPVLDRTDLTSRYDIDLKWSEDRQNPNPEALKQALTDTLGLELTPGIQPIEMLVVKKAK